MGIRAVSQSATSTVIDVFRQCVSAMQRRKFIARESRQDKEFHFQNWVHARLEETGFQYEIGGRNSYPDFRMVCFTEGYEVKGLAYPGREVNYDCNSQVPSGNHNGRTIYYIFGRYPSTPDGDSYPVLDLVVSHGDFLNADHEYVHKNKSVRGFGSYGDIMIRDRKMYVAPTPFGLAAGVAHTQTLILPGDLKLPGPFKHVGTLVRKEAETMIVGYSFGLRDNSLMPEIAPNPAAGREHLFRAWRLTGGSGDRVTMRQTGVVASEGEDDADHQE